MHPILPLQYTAISFSNYSLCFQDLRRFFMFATFFYLSKMRWFLFFLLFSPFIDFSPSPPIFSPFFYFYSFKQDRDVDTYNKYLGKYQKPDIFYYSSMHKWRRVQTMEITDRVPATLSLLEARQQKCILRQISPRNLGGFSTSSLLQERRNRGQCESCQRSGNVMSCSANYYLGHWLFGLC